MDCPACNAENALQSKFCSSCGTPLAQVCEACAHRNPPDAKFCNECGGQLAQRKPDPEPAKGWGVRKQGTVLFADVVGSTQMIANMDPEQAMEVLKPSVQLMNATVRRFDASVVQTLGDGIMAIFGLPEAREGHALLACQAAITIQQAIKASGRGLEVRVGLHSGELVVSKIEQGHDPIPHGATVHLASRLEKLAEAGSICMTGDCYQQVRLHCDVEPMGAHSFKGFATPIETYALKGFKPAVASQQFRTASLTPFCGREDELQQLKLALNRAQEGKPCVVGISGAAGTGKSRLCYEFAQLCRQRRIPVHEARALISGEATPLQPVIELLRSILGISQSEDRDSAVARIQAHPCLAGLEDEADTLLLCQFLGLFTLDEVPPPRGSETRASRLRKIVRHLIGQLGERSNVILFEDLHWLDAASADYLGAIIGAIAGTRILVVVNYRDFDGADWMTGAGFKRIAIGELRAGQTAAIVEELMGQNPALGGVRSQIVERCAGNPFFAEELVRSLIGSGALQGDMGDLRPGPAADLDVLPASVQDTICARIDSLSAQDKAIVQLASIIGKEFPLSVVRSVFSGSGEDLEASIARLVRARIVQPQSSTGEEEYIFIHPLFQETAYNEQLKGQRSAAHDKIARAFEQHYHDRVDAFSALICHHHEGAGNQIRAAEFAAKAAVWVGSANAAQALRHWHDVRRLLADAPSEPTHDELRMRASGQIAMFGWREGMTAEEARPYIDDAIAWARGSANPNTSLLLAADGRIAVSSGRSADEYLVRAEEALQADDCAERSRPHRDHQRLRLPCQFSGWVFESGARGQ